MQASRPVIVGGLETGEGEGSGLESMKILRGWSCLWISRWFGRRCNSQAESDLDGVLDVCMKTRMLEQEDLMTSGCNVIFLL